MSKNIISSLKFKDYIVEEISYKANSIFENDKVTLDFSINSDVEQIDETKFAVSLGINVFEDYQEKNYPFNMIVKITGFFEVNNVSEEVKLAFIEKNSVTILFPYLRALITTYTSTANIQPLILPPMNISKYIEQKYEN